MSPLRFARMVGLALPLACSSSSPAPVGDGRRFVPENLPASLQDGEQGVTLQLVAFTLVQGASGPEFYAAVKNEGAAPSCNAGMMTELFSKSGDSLAMVGSALRGKQLYRLGSDVVLNCIDPGQTGMVASTEFGAGVAVAEVAAVKYRFPTFEVDGIEPLAGITVDALESVSAGMESAFEGVLRNGTSLTVSNPSVTIFPLNRAGRPLGAGLDSETRVLAPSDSWRFETTAVTDVGVELAAFASVSIPAS